MRIISKFHDYYDSLRSYENYDSSDYREHMYIRNEEEIKKSYHVDDQLARYVYDRMGWLDDECSPTYIIGFCGTLFPVIDLSWNKLKSKFNWEIRHELIYDMDGYAASEYIVVNERKKNHKLYENMFANPFWKKDYTELFIELNSPVFLISKYEHNDYTASKTNTVDINFHLNPQLSKYEFYKVMDAHRTYQQIDYFVSNVMVNDKNPPVQISDDVMRDQKGFDDMSFKKYPTKKKKK